MRDKTTFPTNFLDAPRVAPLLPELKLILGLGLIGGRYTNTIGVASVPVKALAASLGLDPAALENGIKTLSSANLIVDDWNTLEFFVIDWFRFHTFNGLGREIAAKELLKIQSQKIRAGVLKAAPWITPTIAELSEKKTNKNQHHKPPTATSTPSAANNKIRIRRASGLVTFYAEDIRYAEEIEQKFDENTLQLAIRTAESYGKEPVPGTIQKIIEGILKQRAKAEREREAMTKKAPVASKEVAADGLKTAWASLKKVKKN